VLLQAKYPVPENCTAFQLRDYLAVKGSALVCNVCWTLTVGAVFFVSNAQFVSNAESFPLIAVMIFVLV